MIIIIHEIVSVIVDMQPDIYVENVKIKTLGFINPTYRTIN